MRNESAVLGSVPPETSRSERDTKYGTNMGRWFLMTIGVWPLPADSHIMKKILCETWVVMCHVLIIFILVPAFLNTVLVQKDPRKQIRMIGPMIFCLTALTKYNFLVGHRPGISACVEHMNADFRRAKCEDDRTIVLNYAKTGRHIATVSTTLMYAAGFFYRTILPLTRPTIVTPNNLTVRPLTAPIYDPLFSAYTYRSWTIVFIGQWFSGYVMYTTAVGACNLAIVFVLHACGQLKLVMARLESCVEGNKHVPAGVEDRVAEIVELHVRSLCFAFRVESILNKVCFAEVGGCTLVICFLGYYLITDVNSHETAISLLTYYVLIISFTFNIFIYCYIGEMLTQQGMKVGTVAYLIDWHKLPVSSAKGIMLIISMSGYPTSITAGRMMQLSYNSFLSIMKTSVAYLNVLREMTD
ncbi:uncharacterized protein LOC107038274 [Diachasma alloeum]|uniref:Odorant receptor n=1 Tax=Diachasma alloeum TaxID=454923 RepID=A0A4E0RQH1_9HYME|nr:uncharacterized protein LOC107038274 [Diachasma alloeum]THK33034.1 odorant receptor 7 [Diachasma alloeum]